MHGTFSGKDKRGSKPSANKTSNESLEFSQNHIKMFPRIESHYSLIKLKKNIYLKI